MPHIEYGPPGHKGVTQIMGLGATGPVATSIQLVPQDKPTRTVAGLAALTWLGGAVMGVTNAKHLALGGLVAIVAIQVLKKRRVLLTPLPAPTSTQGWG